MDSINVQTTIGDSGREFTVDPNGGLMIGLTDGKPQSAVLTNEQWMAFIDGLQNHCGDYFQSGSAEQQEAYRLVTGLHASAAQQKPTTRSGS